jgi:hypothetical protein
MPRSAIRIAWPSFCPEKCQQRRACRTGIVATGQIKGDKIAILNDKITYLSSFLPALSPVVAERFLLYRHPGRRHLGEGTPKVRIHLPICISSTYTFIYHLSAFRPPPFSSPYTDFYALTGMDFAL